MYDREINGQELSFGVSGKLIRNVLVMYDRETESLWSQLLGEAVAGELLGDKLEYLPSWHTTWKKWKELYPDTLALKKGILRSRDPYVSYYQSSSAGIIGETIPDDRLSKKEFVVGVELINGEAVAYPFRTLSSEPVVNDTIDDYDILVVFDNDSATGVVFDRHLENQILTFSQSITDPNHLLDAETQSVWIALTGEAIEGELVGQKLARIKSSASFWFGWNDFHPETAVYGIDDDNPNG